MAPLSCRSSRRGAFAFAASAAMACSDSSSGRLDPGRRQTGVDVRTDPLPLGALAFACVGDTRPPFENDVAEYPTQVITRIFEGIETVRPRLPFAIATGDYVFASSGSLVAASQQFDLYRAARARYTGFFFPAMGNHECTAATSSNCGPGSADGMPAPYVAFLDKMLSPIGLREPYFAVRVHEGAWSAKVVFIAANAWSLRQENWLESTLAEPTTYTFIVRHEPAEVPIAPGVVPSERVMSRHPYTLSIVGHSHTYRHSSQFPREVLIGNGGAPLGAKHYGFGLFRQRADGAVVVDMIHWLTGEADPEFHFVVQADGTPSH